MLSVFINELKDLMIHTQEKHVKIHNATRNLFEAFETSGIEPGISINFATKDLIMDTICDVLREEFKQQVKDLAEKRLTVDSDADFLAKISPCTISGYLIGYYKTKSGKITQPNTEESSLPEQTKAKNVSANGS